jgi:hypothetical protein
MSLVRAKECVVIASVIICVIGNFPPASSPKKQKELTIEVLSSLFPFIGKVKYDSKNHNLEN